MTPPQQSRPGAPQDGLSVVFRRRTESPLSEPAARPPGPESTVTATAADQKPSVPTVLCIDDSPIHLQILYRYFEHSLGCRARGADGVEQAVLRLLREPVDLLVADLMMPGLDGLDLITILRARDAWRDLPVVIVSAMSDLKQIETLNSLGIKDYIVKPFNPAIAVPRLKKLMATLPLSSERKSTEPVHLEEGQIPILLACARPEVADLVRSAVEPPYDLSVADSGPSAVIKALEIHPWVVFLTGDLGTWDSGKTLRSLVGLKTLEGIRVIPLPHPDRGARVITEAVLRDLSPAPFSVAAAGKSITATLEGTFRASCLGALRVALSGAISVETERVVFELPSEGIGKQLFPVLQEMALLSKLEV